MRHWDDWTRRSNEQMTYRTSERIARPEQQPHQDHHHVRKAMRTKPFRKQLSAFSYPFVFFFFVFSRLSLCTNSLFLCFSLTPPLTLPPLTSRQTPNPPQTLHIIYRVHVWLVGMMFAFSLLPPLTSFSFPPSQSNHTVQFSCELQQAVPRRRRRRRAAAWS